MMSFSLILGGVSCALCQQGSSPRDRAAVLPRLRELRRSVEPTRTHMAPLLRIFVRGK